MTLPYYFSRVLHLIRLAWAWLCFYLPPKGTNTLIRHWNTERERANQSQLSLISSTMEMDEVVACLVQHGCKDITSDIDIEHCFQHPFARGGFGAIYQGMLRDGRPVAMKCIELSGHWGAWSREPKSLKHTAHEMYTWSKCDHPGILKVLGFVRFRGQFLVVSPWMQKGSIPHYIPQYPRCNRLQLCIQLATAVEYLHSRGLVHGDIKAENVVVSDHGHAQLADFGSAILIKYTTLYFTQTGCSKGTLRFTAPELLNGTADKPTFGADVYALGMTVLQIMTGRPPYANKTDHAIVFQVTIKKCPPDRPDFSQTLPNKGAEDKLWELLVKCWTHAPGDRPTAMKVKDTLIEIEQIA